MSIGKRLKTLRESLNLKQEEIGEIIGVGRTTYSGYENDKQSITASQLLLLYLQYPNIDLHKLITGKATETNFDEIQNVEKTYIQEKVELNRQDIQSLKEGFQELQADIKKTKDIEKWRGQVNYNYEQLFQLVKELEKNKVDRV